MPGMTWMIYGATGYTGELIAREAVKRGLKPILAGRSEGVRALGTELGLSVRVFGLEDANQIVRGLEGVRVVLHCAGPFTITAQPMLEACLKAKVHYLDITGEIDVFEKLYARDPEVKNAGITAVSGVGFDVVPTDTVAALLARDMPDATSLRLGIKALEGVSRGTAKTWLEIAARGGSVRRNGRLEPVPIAAHSRMIPFSKDAFGYAVNMPSAELSSMYRTTKIPNIEVFMASTKSSARTLRISGLIGPLLRIESLRRFAQKQIERSVTGPNAEARASGRTTIWGEVSNATGHSKSLRLHGPEAYHFSVFAALEAVRRVLEGGVPTGALTPTMAFGAEFALSIPGTQLEEI
jgi:short subunit dehydrogenase-like uncharacterized protein